MKRTNKDVSDMSNYIDKFLECLLPSEVMQNEKEHLDKTPERITKAYIELTSGYYEDPKEILKAAFTESSDMVVMRDVDFVSLCEHHMLPFFGKAHIAYLPEGRRVVGLSKLARIVHCYARRLQVQERLNRQIADALFEIFRCKACMVVMEATHMCMTIRGVKSQNAVTITSAIRGDFPKDEALNLIKGVKG